MKLQGKKTGTFAGFIGYIDDTPNIDPMTCSVMLSIRYKDAGKNCYKDYNTIAEFNADWEDYKPTEPLIKDEKIREAVRAWAAAANVKTDKIRVSKGTFFTSFIGWIDGLVGGLEISFRTGDAFEAINDGTEVTLTELCGEEE